MPQTLPTHAQTLRAFFRGLNPQRVTFTLGISSLLALVLSPVFVTPTPVLVGRSMVIGLLALLTFVGLECWPRRLPRWLARWLLQLVGVALAVPLGTLVVYMVAVGGNFAAFWQSEARMMGFLYTAASGLVLGPLVAMAALYRQRDAEARSQALGFELERSELERRALDARLRLLHAQIEPHFLFNTLANVRALVDAGSPKASAVLSSLIAYLRAAVPRLNDEASNLGQEIQLVRAYLELMHLRMPDRLAYALDVAPAAESLTCPPMTVLTLVENAIRHGIDPSEEGGRIDVTVQLEGEGAAQRCRVQVRDTGVGLRQGGSPGLGLANLRERLQLSLGAQAQLHLSEVQPHGVCAELILPIKKP
ncbi:sensor histidine kinase [Inhella sp.]|uniref:sensor histidine kinase n=1 Tax=Inhella sp. TaxID=1921806 RepID=UPI0035B06270